MANRQRRWEAEFPSILGMWDYDKNEIRPDQTAFSRQVNWLCSAGHSWRASPYDMAQRNWCGCPICNDKKFINPQRNFATAYPLLLREWDFSKNVLVPDRLNPHSGKYVWWKCEKGHSWRTSPNARTKGYGCPCCAGQIACVDNNLSLYPVAREFHPTKNGNLQPAEIVPGSGLKVWWICNKGHEFKSMVRERITKEVGCPKCKRKFSLMELRVYAELVSLFPDSQWGAKINGYEVDVFIKSLNLGIEVDGHYWHKDKFDFDSQKSRDLARDGICIVRLREIPLPLISEIDIGYRHTVGAENLCLLKKLVKRIGEACQVDVSSYLNASEFINPSLYGKLIFETKGPSQSVTDVAPFLIKEWHPIRNGNLKPEYFSYGSQQKAWWVCQNKHEWEAVIATRVKGHGCPRCYEERR